jgi:outer membrane immunogenic protein
MMTKFLALLCAAVGFGGSAVDTDLPAPAPATIYVPPVVPVHNWTGSYVGVNGGWGWRSAQWTVAPIPTILASGLSNSINDNGGIVGGTLSFNWQIPGFGGFVFGAEGYWAPRAVA